MCSKRENTMAFKKRFIIQEAGHGVQEFSSSAKRPCLGTMSSASSSMTNLTFPTPLSSYSSSEEIEAHSSDTGTDNSTWYPDTSSSESSLGVADDNHDCKVFSTLRHGAVSLSLEGTNLWYKFFNLGTEMIINRQGRRMFPSIVFSLNGLETTGLYDIYFDIVPASNYCFKFINNKWRAIGEAENEFENKPYKHPESPRCGSEWMSRTISFQDVKLSNKPGEDNCIFVLRTFQKYLVRISLIKHERETSSKVEFLLSATTFVAVSAYNNREITKLKIDSNPYSKAFRMKVSSPKQKGLTDYEKGMSKLTRTKSMERSIKDSHFAQRTMFLHAKQDNIYQEVSKQDQGTQTDVSMADFNLWYKFLHCPLASSFRSFKPPLALSRYQDTIQGARGNERSDLNFLNRSSSSDSSIPSS